MGIHHKTRLESPGLYVSTLSLRNAPLEGEAETSLARLSERIAQLTIFVTAYVDQSGELMKGSSVSATWLNVSNQSWFAGQPDVCVGLSEAGQ
jgi:hypothetical protein